MDDRAPGYSENQFYRLNGNGKKVMAGAAKHLKQLTLELGGNDAAIVMEDADPKKFVKRIFGRLSAIRRKFVLHRNACLFMKKFMTNF